MLSITLFVDDDASAGGYGLSWSTALNDLQDALTMAEVLNADELAANDVDAIWIAEGTYLPTSELEPGDARSASFSLLDNVTLYGGFNGTETTLADRDLSAGHTTILSGDLDVADFHFDNAYTVVYCDDTIETSLDGLTIADGNADGDYDADHYEKVDGGGIYNKGILTVANSTISDNATRRQGGGIFNTGTLTITDSTISDNLVTDYAGGGIYNDNSTLTVTNSRFLNNSASHGGGIYSYAYTGTAAATFTDCVFSNNSASGQGGAIYGEDFVDALRLTNCTISDNSAGSGGGVFNSSGTMVITNSEISNNTAETHGGGIFNSVAMLTLDSSVISDNSAGEKGGGICGTRPRITNSTISGNSAGTLGGGIYGAASIINSTIVDNSANESGGGLYSYWGSTINNTIIASNEASNCPDIFKYFTALSGSHNLIGDGTGQNDLVDGVDGNLVGTAASPIDPMLSDWTPLSNGQWGYHLLFGSPAIDTGDNSLAVDAVGDPLTEDMVGNPRIVNTTVDMGAMEWATPGSPAQTYVVTSLDETIATDGVLTFIEALQAAQLNQAVGDAPAGSYSEQDVIQFASGLSGTILVDDGELDLFSSLRIEGPGGGQITFDAAEQNRVFYVRLMPDVSLSGITITGGRAGDGGAIYNKGTLAVADCTVLGNAAGDSGGGGIYNHGVLTVTGSTLVNNLAEGNGGGIYNNEGTLNVLGSTFLKNSTEDDGGAIFNNLGTMTFINSVLSDNTARSDGGGIYNDGTMAVINSTLADNSAGHKGGGICKSGSSAVTTLDNAIVAGNNAPSGPDVYRPISASHSLIGDGTYSGLAHGVHGNLVGTSSSPIDPMLSDWSQLDNGLWGYYLLAGSPAIDTGDNSLAVDAAGNPLTEDLSGNPRIVNTTVDMGAMEWATAGNAGQTYIVTSLDDTIANDGVFTFLEVFQAANTNQPVGDAAAGSYREQDIILFAPGLSGTSLIDDGQLTVWGELSINGPGNGLITLDAARQNRAFLISSIASVSLSGITITGGATEEGGGIYNKGTLAITNASVSNNSSENEGGGIYNHGMLTLTNSTVSENSSGYFGGGGIYNDGTLTLMGSAISGNSTVYNGGGIKNDGTLSVANSTFSGNVAEENGGGIYSKGTLTVTNSTLVDNAAIHDGGGIFNYGSSPAVINNTIVARNQAPSGPDIYCSGTFSGSHNLIGDGTDQSTLVDGVDGNQVGTSASPIDPMLSQYTQFANGAWGYFPLPGSSAIDAGDNSLAVDATGHPLVQDLRGYPRIINGAVDIGAVEGTATSNPAHTYVVTSLDEIIAVDGVLTFIEALKAAQSNQPVGDAPAGSNLEQDVIQFAAGLSGTILVDDGALTIVGDLAIEGPGAGQIVFDATGQNRVFTIQPSTDVALGGITITGGTADNGGGIYNNGTLAVTDSTISGNAATGYIGGGGIFNNGTLTVTGSTLSDNAAYNGAGIYNLQGQALTVTDSTLSGNAAVNYGGGIYGKNSTLTITGSTFSGNTAGYGAGIHNESFQETATLTVTGSTFSNNAATYDGGGIYNYTREGTATLTVAGSTFSDNTAADNGGGIYSESYKGDATLTATGSTFTGNSSVFGAGIYGGVYNGNSTIALTACTLSGNSAELGGAIYNETLGASTNYPQGGIATLTVTDSTLSGNSAAFGGAICSYTEEGDLTLYVTDSILSDNASEHGGGIYNGNYAGTVTLKVTNSLLTGNTADVGGGIDNDSDEGSSTLEVVNSTLSDNVGRENGGGIYNIGNSAVTVLNNTIVAGNEAPTTPDVYGDAGTISGSHNLIGDGTGQTDLVDGIDGNLVGTAASPIDPMFVDPAGGDYQILATSPAIDAGDNSLAVDPYGNPLLEDLAGGFRVVNEAVDIGAYEYCVPDMPQLYVVTSLDEIIARDGVLTFVEAFQAANTNLPVGDAPAGSASHSDTIRFAAGLSGTIWVDDGQLTIEDDLSIEGPNTRDIIFDADEQNRVFEIQPGVSANFSGITITRGRLVNNGAGIYNDNGILTLTNCTLSQNLANYSNSGGAVYNNKGMLTVTNCTLSQNRGGSGGGIYSDGTLTVADSTFLDNSSYGGRGYGGAICNSYGTVTITNSAISGNLADNVGHGGGICNSYGTMTVINSTISENTTDDYIDDDGGGGIYNSGDLTLITCIISGNSVEDNGGGIYNAGTLTITDSTISGNSCNRHGDGAGIYNAGGTLMITNSIISDNSGNGIYNANGTATITGSTISHNSALSGGGIYDNGGGIYNSGTLTVTNSSLSHNYAYNGAGIYNANEETATLTVTNSTISNNSADNFGGGIYCGARSLETMLNNTIVAGNEASTDPDVYCSSDALFGSNNLIGDGSGQSTLVNGVDGNQVGTSSNPIDPMLSEWSQFENGQWGYYLLPSSHAINTGDNTLAVDAAGQPLTEDVSGNPRIVNTTVDMGAVEWVSVGNSAQTYMVTSLEKTIAEDGVLTFLEAFQAANTNLSTGDAPAGSYFEQDTIQFADDLSGTVLVDDGELTIFGTLRIDGPGDGLITFDAAGQNRVFFILPIASASLSGITIADGAAENGGGIYNNGTLELTDCILSDNSAEKSGGGIGNDGTLTSTNCVFSGNSAEDYGGGISNYNISNVTNCMVSNNSAGLGGGFFSDGGLLTVTNSTIFSNSAGSNGGGIANHHKNTLSITNSTLWGNSAEKNGGGIYNGYPSTSSITNSTISGNSAGERGGGICCDGYQFTTLNNTIFAANAAVYGSDICGEIRKSSFNNLIGDGTGQSGLVDGVNGNMVGTEESPIDPVLSNFTQSADGQWGYYLLPGSPAIDMGDNSLAVDATGQPLPEDIYGNPRIVNATVDIGAVEGATAGNPAQTYVVTSLENTIAVDGILTFAEAFQAAKTNQPAGDAPAGSYSEQDVIQFASGLSGTILVNDGELAIFGDLSIEGPGAGLLTFDAGGQNRVFHIYPNVSASLTGMTITGGFTNTGDVGGGIYNFGTLSIADAVISDNSLSNHTYSFGAGIYNGGTLSMTSSTVSNNSADALYSSGGGICNIGTLSITDSTISNNSLSSGHISRGGGIYNEGTLSITNSAITDNSANTNGRDDESSGGGICNHGTMTVTNCTIANNSVSSTRSRSVGGGGGICSLRDFSLNNTIIADNALINSEDFVGPDVYCYSGTISGSHNLIGDGTGQSGLVDGVDGNLVGTTASPIDPGFVDPGNGNYRLDTGSPAIDAGDNALIPSGVITDLDGNYRIANGTVDMGAYEYGSTPLLDGDANGDGKVDSSDLALMANHWQEGTPDGDPENVTWPMGDFNHDGKVDSSDLALLSNNWQTAVSSAPLVILKATAQEAEPEKTRTRYTPPSDTLLGVATVRQQKTLPPRCLVVPAPAATDAALAGSLEETEDFTAIARDIAAASVKDVRDSSDVFGMLELDLYDDFE